MAQLPILKLHDPTFLPAPVTITVANIKGGVGKTTLATNLAVWAAIRRFAKTALIDTDAQQSAATFANMRAETLGDPLFTCVSILNAEALKVHAKRIAAYHADHHRRRRPRHGDPASRAPDLGRRAHPARPARLRRLGPAADG
ncbi:ParA family protein (plasmid) [Azospirillum sp. A29]|uniref:ParA family protein n=1 Tax=Azospirillum sp. A29 TaxID=3160606 RepID=UPI003671DFF5